jgi:hypothetical protein
MFGGVIGTYQVGIEEEDVLLGLCAGFSGGGFGLPVSICVWRHEEIIEELAVVREIVWENRVAFQPIRGGGFRSSMDQERVGEVGRAVREWRSRRIRS